MGKRNAKNFGVMAPGYKENPELDDKFQIVSNFNFFISSYKKGKPTFIWGPSERVYYTIRKFLIASKPRSVLEVGSGSGCGANILSMAGIRHIVGIDKNDMSVKFATSAFSRTDHDTNNTLCFIRGDFLEINPVLDKYDAIVCVGVIEHIYESTRALNKMKSLCHPGGKVYISTDNRGNPNLGQKQPENIAHVREWNSTEFERYLKTVFGKVTMYSKNGSRLQKKDDVMLAVCEVK